MGRRPPFEPLRFPGALTAGSTRVAAPESGWVRGGILVFYQDALAVFPDSGRQSVKTPYALIASYGLKRGMLTLRGTDGTTFNLRIGKEMAANASYILRAKEVRTRR